MMYDWHGRFFQGRLILWYFQFPAGINQSRVADQFPVQGDDLGHGAAVLSGDFPEGVALSDDVYPNFLILRQNSIGSAACDRSSALGNLKLPAGVIRFGFLIRSLLAATIPVMEQLYFLAIFQRVSPACTV